MIYYGGEWKEFRHLIMSSFYFLLLPSFLSYLSSLPPPSSFSVPSFLFSLSLLLSFPFFQSLFSFFFILLLLPPSSFSFSFLLTRSEDSIPFQDRPANQRLHTLQHNLLDQREHWSYFVREPLLWRGEVWCAKRKKKK